MGKIVRPSKEAQQAAENLARMAHVLPGGSWRDIPHHLLPAGMRRARKSDHTRRYGRLHPHEPSGTVLTKCDPHWGTVVHYAQDRVLSVREAARIQSFPDTFRFTGGKPAMYRQAGNAVPPLLARAVARHLAGLLAAAKALGLAA
jgi:DNA (cytosine-5)-methyltransferase 1